MKNMKQHTLAVAVTMAVMSLGISPVAQAITPSWTYISPATSPITVSWINGNKTGTSVVTYSPVAAEVWAYDGNLASQSQNAVMQDMQNQFGLPSYALGSVMQCANASACTTGGDGTRTSATWSTGQNYFDYLAVHYGQGELFLHFATPVNDFTVQGLHNGLSNFYAFADGELAPAVAEPAPLFMLAVGMMGLVWRQRRNSR